MWAHFLPLEIYSFFQANNQNSTSRFSKYPQGTREKQLNAKQTQLDMRPRTPYNVDIFENSVNDCWISLKIISKNYFWKLFLNIILNIILKIIFEIILKNSLKNILKIILKLFWKLFWKLFLKKIFFACLILSVAYLATLFDATFFPGPHSMLRHSEMLKQGGKWSICMEKYTLKPKNIFMYKSRQADK